MRKIAQVCFLVFLVFFLGGCWEKEAAAPVVVQAETTAAQEESQGEDGEMSATMREEEETRKQEKQRPVNQQNYTVAKINGKVTDAFERMQNVCMARSPIDRVPCYREHESLFFQHINRFVIDVVSRRSDFPEAWFETFRAIAGRTEHNIGNMCMKEAGNNHAERAKCNMLQYFVLSNWGDLLENDAWKGAEIAQVGYKIIQAREAKKAEERSWVNDPEAMVRSICSKPSRERSPGEDALCRSRQ